jgi:hypothetical protein
LSNVGVDRIVQGIKAGVGASMIGKAELSDLDSSDIAKTAGRVANLVQKTTEILRDVGVLGK